MKRLRLRSCVFFITWLRLRLRSGSGCALLIHFNNFGFPSVLLVASERVIPTYFKHCYHYQACIVGRSLVWSRGHQHGDRGRQVARADHVGRPRACSDNSKTWSVSSHWWISLIFINDSIIENKLKKILFQKCVSNWEPFVWICTKK